MRAFFLLIVLANLLFYVVHQGYLGKIIPDSREPERLNQQVNPDKLKRLSLQEFETLTTKPAAQIELPTNESRLAQLEGKNCVQFGIFVGDEQRRIETWLKPLALGDRVTTRTMEEQASWAVYIPPLKTKADADKKMQELRALGVKDFFVVQDDGDLHLAISLGVFKTEEAAKTHLTNLNKKGVKTAKVGQRGVTVSKAYLQFQKPDTALLRKLVELKSMFPAQELSECSSVDTAKK